MVWYLLVENGGVRILVAGVSYYFVRDKEALCLDPGLMSRAPARFLIYVSARNTGVACAQL